MKGIFIKSLGTIAAVVFLAYTNLLSGVSGDIQSAILVGASLAIAYALFRPVARILLGIFNFLTLGVIGIILDAAIFMFCGNAVPGFTVAGFEWALLSAVVVNVTRQVFGIAGKIGAR